MERHFSRVASAVAHASGKPITFLACCVVIALWAATGPVFGFSDTWQLIINTGTTVVTFLMVFLIQNTQNRDGVAIQAKLDELIRVSKAHNSFIGIEHLSEHEVEEFRRRCEDGAKKADARIEAIRLAKAHARKTESPANRSKRDSAPPEEG